MCLPAVALAWAAFAASAAGSVATVVAQKQQAVAQERQQTALTKANNASAYSQMSQLRIQQAQTNESTARETEKARLANQRAMSTGTVAAGEAGVQGNSVAGLLQEYGMQFGQFKEASTRQAQLNASGTENQLEAVRLNGDAQNLNINAPITQPNYLGEGLKVAGSALSTYRSYNPSAFQKKP